MRCLRSVIAWGAVLFCTASAGPTQTSEDGALTRQRLQFLATAAEATRLRDNRYPALNELNRMTQLLVTAYVRDLPYRDEWGTPFRYTLEGDGKHLTIASAGPNRVFEDCGDDLAMRDGRMICPQSGAPVVIEPSAIDRWAAKLTMRDMGELWVAIEGYKSAHGTLPRDLAAAASEAGSHSIDPFPWRDAWGLRYGYELAGGGYRISSGNGDVVYDGTRFLRAPRGLAAALFWLVWPSQVYEPLFLRTGVDHHIREEEVLETTPAGRVSFLVVVEAPVDDADVEHPEVRANQAPGYFDHRPAPNLEIAARRIDGENSPATVRVVSSGGGGSEREAMCEVSIDLLGSAEERQERMRAFFAQAAETLKLAPSQAAALSRGFDDMYVRNPPGLWEISVSYKPSSGAYAGQTLRRRFRLHVAPGPDSLDLIFHH